MGDNVRLDTELIRVTSVLLYGQQAGEAFAERTQKVVSSLGR